jgi:ATP-binding cassette subfamily B protein
VVIGRLWSYLRRQKSSLAVTAVLVAATSGLSLLGPLLLGRALDRYIIPGDLRGLEGLCALMLAVHLSNASLIWLQNYIMAGAAQRTLRDVRADLFASLQRLPLRFFDSQSHGDLMSRLTNDVGNIDRVLGGVVTSIVASLIGLVGTAAMMLALNPMLAGVTLLTVCTFSLILNRWVAVRARSGFRQQQASLGALNGLIEETIGGQKVVKAYRREKAALEEFDRHNTELRDAATKAQIYAGVIGPLMNGTNNFSLAVVAGVGGALAVRGLATVGTIASFVGYARQFMRPLNDLANLYNALQSALAGAERVFQVIDEPPETDASETSPLPSLRGDVVFENVSFSYEPGTPVLEEVSLHARPGETVALIGPTGAGKTTIVNLLTRFYEIDGGRILVDGQDIRHLPKGELRRHLGIVLQDTYLFSGTVMDNLRYGRLDATDEEVVAAAKLAEAHSFIHHLPQGYDTPLSERASNLSQGQRQLLAIARAILADPRILILDEATSSVDTRTEKHIQEAMRRLMAGRTSFVIAHRLSTIREADQILVIDRGRILERGNHQELLAQKGLYHNLSTGLFGEVED